MTPRTGRSGSGTAPASGWPDRVDAPGTHGGPWEQSAAKWLFDHVPGEWREGLNGPQYRRHPLMLARDAHYLVRGQVEALREAYRRARVDLAEHFEPQQIDETCRSSWCTTPYLASAGCRARDVAPLVAASGAARSLR